MQLVRPAPQDLGDCVTDSMQGEQRTYMPFLQRQKLPLLF